MAGSGAFRGRQSATFRSSEYGFEFPEIREQPSYFKKEDLQSQEMSFGELSKLHPGLEAERVRYHAAARAVDAEDRLSGDHAGDGDPGGAVCAVDGKEADRWTGIATAIGLAIAYWVVAGLFEAMGNVNTLPPMLAAWSPDLLFGIAGAYLLLRTPT